MWQLEWGEDYDFLLEQFERGESTPAIENKPECGADTRYLLDLWLVLAQGRPDSWGGVARNRIGDIKTVYRAYAVRYFCAESDFIDSMQFLDGVFRDEQHRLMEDEERKKKKKDIIAGKKYG